MDDMDLNLVIRERVRKKILEDEEYPRGVIW